jgi:uncharacterized MAPEG superfamily protein
MTSELTVLALAGLLQGVQFGLLSIAANRQVGPSRTFGPRDAPVGLRGIAARLDRALDNHFQALTLFTLAVAVVSLSGRNSALTAICAWLYLAARVLYIPAYAFGWVPWRSVIFSVGLGATLVMILAALAG